MKPLQKLGIKIEIGWNQRLGITHKLFVSHQAHINWLKLLPEETKRVVRESSSTEWTRMREVDKAIFKREWELKEVFWVE